jgi:hypothetical protein
VFDKDVDSLRDKKVLVFDSDSVVRIGVVLPETSYQVFKPTTQVDAESESASDPPWSTSEGEEWTAEKVDEFLGRIDDVSCTAFSESLISELSEPLVRIEVQTQEEEFLSLYEETSNGYLAASSQSPYAFFVSEWLGERLLEAVGGNLGG